MHFVMNPSKAALLGLCLTFTACSSQVIEKRETPFSQVISLEIGSRTNRSQLEAQYGGKAIAWHPEAGLAILGIYEGELSTLSTNLNSDVFKTPEVTAGGSRAWGGGHRAWGGGYKAWGGGSSSVPTTFSENAPLWSQIRLTQGQNVARDLGRGVKVAVIDTGLELTHPAFVGKLAPASEWKDFVDGDTNPQEVAGGPAYGHGTGVAGVILQVAPRATILPLRVLGTDGSGDVDDVVAAIDWAVRRGANIVNLSLGAEVPVSSLTSIVNYATSRGVYVVSSSGNTGDRNVTYPAAESMVGSGGAKYRSIGVGSVSLSNRKSSFSTYGDYLELVAPGEQLFTAFPGGQLAYWSGTSFATPIVSGALALGLSNASSGDHAENLISKAKDVSSVNREFKLGKGLIDVETFLKNMQSDD